MATTDRVLVCEGACNAFRLQRFDKLSAAHHRKNYDRGVEAAVSEPAVLELGRRLAHTRHIPLSESRYQCTVCCATRQYGSIDQALVGAHTVEQDPTWSPARNAGFAE